MTNTPQVPATAQGLADLIKCWLDPHATKVAASWQEVAAYVDRLAALAEAQGARSAEAPFDLETLKEQAGAWLMVAQTLHEVAPWWTEGASNGRDSACSAIRRLATHPAHPQVAAVVPKAQAPSAEALAVWIKSIHRDAWIDACSTAIRRLAPELSHENARDLAAQLWDELGANTVRPDLMAHALVEQAHIIAGGTHG